MILLLVACAQSIPPTTSFFASPKADTAGPGDSADSADSGDSGDSGQDSDSQSDSDTAAGCDTATGCDSAVTGRLGQSAAELSGEPGGFGCNTAAAGMWGGLIGLGMLVRTLRKQ